MTRTGIKLDLDIGDLLSNAGRARGAISAIGEAMKKAESEGRMDDYGKLAYEKERLQGRTTGFESDIKKFANNPRFQNPGSAPGQPILKVDSEYASLIKAQIEAMKNLTSEYEAAVRKGDFDTARSISPEIEKQQEEFRKIVDQTGSPTGAGKNISGAVHAIGIGQVINALNDGLSRWASSLDRSGIVGQYGSGDILGGRVSEQRRQANFWGGIAQTSLSVLGTGMGFVLGGPGGALLGGTLGGGAGQAINAIAQSGANKEATEAAYAGLWQQRSAGSMELAALQGSPNRVRAAFETAASAAERFGYSAEEGMETLKQIAQQGVDTSLARKVFQYERSTGADRGTLTAVSTMSERYGGGDVLQSGWAGLQASGMKTGQYSEYLRAMQRVMEDGISKGFIRSSDQVAKNLTMLAQLTNNSPLWQGENGARRLMDMNAGLEQATGLQSVSDIIAYRASRESVDRDYVDTMIRMEKGLTPEIFKKYMDLTAGIEGRDNRAGIVERMRQSFGLNYTTAESLYSAWSNNMMMSDTQLQAILNRQSEIPQSDNAELAAAIETQSIVNWWTRTGQTYWDRSLGHLRDELIKAIREYNSATGSNVPLPPGFAAPPLPVADTTNMTVQEAVSTRNQEYVRALTEGTDAEFEEAARRQAIAQTQANAEMLPFYGTATPDHSSDPTWRLGEITKMLTQRAWDNGATFFTGNGLPTKNDDERANDRLMAYYNSNNLQHNVAFDQAIRMLEAFTEDQRRRVNESDRINTAIPDLMTDTTGRLLLEAIRQLADEFGVTVNM